MHRYIFKHKIGISVGKDKNKTNSRTQAGGTPIRDVIVMLK